MLQFCAEYGKLNAAEVIGSYPILRVEECIGLSARAAIFPTVYTDKGYWKVKIAKKDGQKFISESHHTCFQFIYTMFGFRNMPGIFHRTTDIILSTIQSKIALCTWTTLRYFQRA